MSVVIEEADKDRMVAILRKHAETSANGLGLRRCRGVPEGDDLTGTAGDRKVIYSSHAAAVACALELRRAFETPMWPYKCPRAKRHHHLTSRRDKVRDTCDCGEPL
jgi:hypothetical protein